jgi:hypothetical protein
VDSVRLSGPGELVNHEIDDMARAGHLLQPRPQPAKLDVGLDDATQQRVQIVDRRPKRQLGLIGLTGLIGCGRRGARSRRQPRDQVADLVEQGEHVIDALARHRARRVAIEREHVFQRV